MCGGSSYQRTSVLTTTLDTPVAKSHDNTAAEEFSQTRMDKAIRCGLRKRVLTIRSRTRASSALWKVTAAQRRATEGRSTIWSLRISAVLDVSDNADCGSSIAAELLTDATPRLFRCAQEMPKLQPMVCFLCKRAAALVRGTAVLCRFGLPAMCGMPTP